MIINKEANLTKEEIDKRIKKFKIRDDKYVHEGYKGFGGTPYNLINWVPEKK